MPQVPFKITETHAGFGRSEGLLNLHDDAMVFEFQNIVAGILKSQVKTIRVPFSDVDSISYEPKLVRTFVEIRFKSLQQVQDFPKSEGAEVRLQIARRDRDKANALVKEAKLSMINDTLGDMLEMTDHALRDA